MFKSTLFILILLNCLISCSSSNSPEDASEEEPNTQPERPTFFDAVSYFEDAATSANLNFTTLLGIASPAFPTADHLERNLGNGAAVGDFDNDGDLDIYILAQTGFSNRLFLNNLETGSKTFTDITPPVLAQTNFMSRVAHFVDLDNDNNLDILLINDGRNGLSNSKIFRNNGDSTFTDVTSVSNNEFSPTGFFRLGCALADYDNDGLIDIYVTNWSNAVTRDSGSYPGVNKLYRNLGDFVFEDVSDILDFNNVNLDSFGAIFKDFNEDLTPDIHQTIDHQEDLFYINDGSSFSESAEVLGVDHTGNDMGVTAADWDDDDDLDIYATNITEPRSEFGTTNYNAFHINQLSETNQFFFIESAVLFNVEDTFWGWGTDFIDIENDGDLDLIAVTGFDNFVEDRVPDAFLYQTPSVLFRNDNGQFNRVSSSGLNEEDDSRTLIVFDYDRDGDEDLLITNINQPVRLLENVAPNQGNWLHLILKPDNKAIGATVYAEINGITKRRDIIAGKSYLAGTPSEVHFGLGDATQVDSLTIRWADGVEQSITNLANLQQNQILNIEYTP